MAGSGCDEFTVFQGVIDDSSDDIECVGVEEHRSWQLGLKTGQHGLQFPVECNSVVVYFLDALPGLTFGREHRRRAADGTHVGNNEFPHS